MALFYNLTAVTILVMACFHSYQCDQENDGTNLREIAQNCQETRDVIQSFLTSTSQQQTPQNCILPTCLFGASGWQGQKGDKGDGGDDGRAGKAGPQGPKGDKGSEGMVGRPGSKGERGGPGPVGAKGDQGICQEQIPGIPQPDFQSEWLELTSQSGTSSFISVHHNLGELPVRVKVLLKAVGGPNDGYIFEGVGSPSADDDLATLTYGGVVYNYNESEVRIFAPDKSNDQENGCIIATGGALWGNKYTQCTHSAKVKVQAWRPLTFPCPDIVTEWFELRSKAGIQSFKEVEHNLRERPSLVVVQYKAKNPEAGFEGYVFEGMGAAQCDDDREWANHGGIVYAVDSWSVRLWAPSRHDSTYTEGNYGGSIINLIDGWGGDVVTIRNDVALVKVSIWKKHLPEPDYKTDWFMQIGQGTGVLPFREIRLPTVIRPDLVQVEVQAIDGPNQGFVFYGMGAQQAHSDYNYGGVVFGYSNSTVRLWSPSSGSGAIVNVIDGWGGEINVQSSKVAMVTVKVWQTYDAESDNVCNPPVINP